MIDDEIKRKVNKYKPKGILVDTNILLLWFVGSVNRQRISQFNRTKKFTLEDYDILVRFLTSFSKIVTTPNILTELSNLVIKDIKEPELSRCFNKLAEALLTEASFKLEEHYMQSRIAIRVNKISEFGLTDCSILELACNRYLVLTDDSKFAGYLTGSGIDVVNFNNLRNM
jgi:rRNA-processing protein FCF1